MIVVFVPDLLYSIKRAFDQNVISTYDLYSGFSTVITWRPPPIPSLKPRGVREGYFSHTILMGGSRCMDFWGLGENGLKLYTMFNKLYGQ